MGLHAGRGLSTPLLDNNLSLHLNLRAVNARTQELEAKLAAAEQRIVKAKARIQSSLDAIGISEDEEGLAASQPTQRVDGQEPDVIDISNEPEGAPQASTQRDNKEQSDVIDISDSEDELGVATCVQKLRSLQAKAFVAPRARGRQRAAGDAPSGPSTEQNTIAKAVDIDISNSEYELDVTACVPKQPSVQDNTCMAPRAHGKKRTAVEVSSSSRTGRNAIANALRSRRDAVRSRDNGSCLEKGSQTAARVVSTTSDERSSKKARMDILSTDRVQEAELKITLPLGLKSNDPYILQVPLPPHVSGRIQVQGLPRILVTTRFMKDHFETVTQTRQLNWDTVRVLDHSFLDPRVDPLAPFRPGNAGLLFSLASEVADNTLQKRIHVFVGNMSSDKYQYRGDYEIARANPDKLPLAAWARLDATCKNKWIRRVECGTNLLALRMRARIIHFQSHGDEATPAEIDTIIKSHVVPDSIAIRQAFNRGLVSLNMWPLICVGFDPDLVGLIQEAQWDSMAP